MASRRRLESSARLTVVSSRSSARNLSAPSGVRKVWFTGAYLAKGVASACRALRQGIGIEQLVVLVERKAVGHAGNVVAHGARQIALGLSPLLSGLGQLGRLTHVALKEVAEQVLGLDL